MQRFTTLLLVGLALVPASARADVELPSVFTDHMVVQRDRPVPVWGRTEPGKEVTVEFAGTAVRTRAGEDGRWRVDLAPQSATDQGRSLVVRGGNTLEIRDVLVGEVWVCSGQSNMEWSVASSMNPNQEIAAATEPRMRMIKAARTLANEPQFTVSGSW